MKHVSQNVESLMINHLLLSIIVWELKLVAVYTTHDFQTAFQLFYDSLIYYFNLSFPLRKHRPRTGKSWVTPEVQSRSRELQQLYELDKQLNDERFHHHYIEMRRQHRQYIQTSKRAYFNNIIELLSNKAKAAWSIVKDQTSQRQGNWREWVILMVAI